MKQVQFAKSFEKSYAKRIAKNEKLRRSYASAYRQFILGVQDYPLFDHSLKGKMSGKRAFSVANDVRVIYIQSNPNKVIFIDIGSHNQVYK